MAQPRDRQLDHPGSPPVPALPSLTVYSSPARRGTGGRLGQPGQAPQTAEQERHGEQLRRFDEHLSSLVTNIGSDNQAVRLNATAALRFFVKEEYPDLHCDLLNVIVANLKAAPEPGVGDLLRRHLAKTLRMLFADGRELDSNIGDRLDLTRVDLYRIDLCGLDLRNKVLLDLAFAKLRHANFRDAKINEVKGGEAVLDGAFFSGAHMNRARFDKATATSDRVRLHRTRLVGATFVGAQFPDAEFHEARLQSAHFKDAILTEAQFKGQMWPTRTSRGPSWTTRRWPACRARSDGERPISRTTFESVAAPVRRRGGSSCALTIRPRRGHSPAVDWTPQVAKGWGRP